MIRLSLAHNGSFGAPRANVNGNTSETGIASADTKVGQRAGRTVRGLLQEGRTALAESSTSPALDTELLLAESLGWRRSRLFAWPEWRPNIHEIEVFRKRLEERRAGRPAAYILGRREFWSLSLEVAEATLIPRPETELLVELALERIPNGAACEIADLGTGSGAIALALGRERAKSKITATDLCIEALRIARSNARRLRILNVQFFQGDWFGGFPRRRAMDMVVSNPPYVAEGDPALDDLRCEPRMALVAGSDGLAAIRRIVAEAPHWLKPGGWLLLEHGADQGPRVAELLEHGGFTETTTERDFGGLNRVSLGRRPP